MYTIQFRTMYSASSAFLRVGRIKNLNLNIYNLFKYINKIKNKKYRDKNLK